MLVVLAILVLWLGLGRPPPQPKPHALASAREPLAPPSASTPPSTSADTASPSPAVAPAEPHFLELGLKITKIHREKRFAWRQIEDVNWQAVAGELPPLPPERTSDPGGCPTGMVRVQGRYLLDPRGRDDTDEVMFLQNKACTFWRTADRGVNGLCDRFDRDRWLAESERLGRRPVDFCIDRYEYPNAYGEFPLVVATYSESQAYCKREGKRLCTESEWTFACEGEEGVPYPYGYARDTEACTMGIMGPGPAKDTFSPRTLDHTAHGVDLSWRGTRSGEAHRCVSPFGVNDLTGNVDEWTTTVRKGGYTMIMKGGHWGPARQRCRPQTRGHGPMYVRYDQGFRCCEGS